MDSRSPTISPTPPSTPGKKTKVSLMGTQGTLLATLYARHLDASSLDPIFGDRWAGYVVDQIDWDWTRFRFSRMFIYLIAMRVRQFDAYTVDFLDRHRDTGCTVIHMACGLDARVHRIQDHYGGRLPANTRWIDVDLPEPMALRKTLLPRPEGEGEYEALGSSVLDPAWLKSMPTDRPTLLLAEGLTCYLEPRTGKGMIRDLTEHFRHAPGGGEVVLDCVAPFMVWMQRLNATIQAFEASWAWGIGSGREVEACHPSLRLVEDMKYAELAGMEKMDWWNWFWLWLTRAPTPGVGRLMKLTFGGVGVDGGGHEGKGAKL